MDTGVLARYEHEPSVGTKEVEEVMWCGRVRASYNFLVGGRDNSPHSCKSHLWRTWPVEAEPWRW